MDYRIRWQQQRRQRQRKRLLIVPGALVLAAVLYVVLRGWGGGGATYWVHQGPAFLSPHFAVTPAIIYTAWPDGHIEALRAIDGDPTGENAYFSVPEGFNATPTLAARVLYVGSDLGVLRALDPRTGQILWKSDLRSPLRAQPLLAQDRLYVGTEGGWLVCFMPGGTAVWSRQLGDGLSGQPAVVNGRLIVCTTRGVVYAFDAATGKPVWLHDLKTPVFSPVTAAPPLVVVGSDTGYLHVLRADNGDKLGEFYSQGLVRTAAAVDDRVIAFGSTDGWLRVVSRNGAQPLWAHPLPGPVVAGPVVNRGRLYVACPSRLLALDEVTGRVVRSWKDGNFAGDLVATDAAIYIGTSHGHVMALAVP